MPAALVLDSHALLAYFREEPGSERVKELLHKAASGDGCDPKRRSGSSDGETYL